METLKPLRLVSIADRALDWPEMARAHTGSEGKYVNAIQEYAQGRDVDMVREVPGEKLTWFTIRRLDADIMDLVLSQDNDHYKYRAALKYSVVRIENLTGLDGQVYTRVEGDDERSVGGVPTKHLSEKQMALIASQYVEEIGGVAFARSFLAPTTGARFPLPRSWPLLLRAKTSQVVADLAKKSAADRDSERSDSAPDTRPPSGDAATDAPATGEATGGATSPSTSGAARSKRRKRPSKRSKK